MTTLVIKEYGRSAIPAVGFVSTDTSSSTSLKEVQTIPYLLNVVAAHCFAAVRQLVSQRRKRARTLAVEANQNKRECGDSKEKVLLVDDLYTTGNPPGRTETG